MTPLIVGWVTGGAIRAEFVRSILALQVHELKHWTLGGVMDQISAYIDENRNMLAKEFLDGTNFDWMLMIDIDMAFNPEAVDDLYQYVEAGEVVIAGIYNQYIANEGLTPLSYYLNEHDLYVSRILEKAEYVDSAPAGFMLINRTPLENIRKDIGDNWFTRIPTKDGRLYGEDVSFCRRIKQYGYNVMGVPKLRIRHMKVVPI